MRIRRLSLKLARYGDVGVGSVLKIMLMREEAEEKSPMQTKKCEEKISLRIIDRGGNDMN